MNNFVKLKELNALQLRQYREAVKEGFPYLISKSLIIEKYWNRLENYFPEFQIYLISSFGDLIGFMNTIPFQFKGSLNTLPEDGWDWMFRKGISDFENKEPPNYLGGLQVIVRKEYQKLGYSKEILNYVKDTVNSSDLRKIVIPIRPTKKHFFPNMSMKAYLNLKEDEQPYDPWLRTHLVGGAEIIKVCNSSMSITGDIEFWKGILKEDILKSRDYLLEGALSPIKIDLEKGIGEYTEPNIWIKYA